MDLIAVSLPERTSTPNQFQTICNWRVRQAPITFHGSTLTADLYKSQLKNNSILNDSLANIRFI